MRTLCFDYGERYIGVAISDELGLIASPLTVIYKNGDNVFKPVMAEIKKIVKENDINLFVLGLPKNMDGTEGIRCEYTHEFKNRLNKYFKSIEVIYVDERFTTNLAMRSLDESGMHYLKKYDNIDKVASSLILQTYLDTINNQK